MATSFGDGQAPSTMTTCLLGKRSVGGRGRR
jgi:hypothetical protein